MSVQKNDIFGEFYHPTQLSWVYKNSIRWPSIKVVGSSGRIKRSGWSSYTTTNHQTTVNHHRSTIANHHYSITTNHHNNNKSPTQHQQITKYTQNITISGHIYSDFKSERRESMTCLRISAMTVAWFECCDTGKT